MDNIVLYILCLIFIVPYFLCLVDKYLNTHLSCKYFGWHNGNGSQQRKFDGCSIHSVCSKCGKEVMQDSQGNWF